MDLDIKSYATYDELEHYCYRVASVVGLLSIPIFGFKDPATRDYAVYLGKALQLTNILRDVKTDAARGRIYLPQSEMVRFGVTAEEIFKGVYSERYERLATVVAAKARHFYQQARVTLPAVDRRSMVTAELMGSVYWQLLLKLEARRFNVFGPESVRLSKARKISLIVSVAWRHITGNTEAPYGTA
jgi:phytoene synthase